MISSMNGKAGNYCGNPVCNIWTATVRYGEGYLWATTWRTQTCVIWLEWCCLCQVNNFIQNKNQIMNQNSKLSKLQYLLNAQAQHNQLGILWNLILSFIYFAATNAIVERGFSAMNRVKKDHRNQLATTTLDELTRILLSGPPEHIYDSSRAATCFLNKKSRRPGQAEKQPQAFQRDSAFHLWMHQHHFLFTEHWCKSSLLNVSISLKHVFELKQSQSKCMHSSLYNNKNDCHRPRIKMINTCMWITFALTLI